MNENNKSVSPDAMQKKFAFFPDMSTHVQTDEQENSDYQSTHVQTSLDNVRFTLTVEQASERLAQAGVPRSPKTVTRFCKDGQLEFTRARTERTLNFSSIQNHWTN